MKLLNISSPHLYALQIYDIFFVTQKAKGSDEARKRTSEALKVFFSDPENRRKRSIAMKGQFLCSYFNAQFSFIIW